MVEALDADALALDQPRLGDQHQNPVEDRRSWTPMQAGFSCWLRDEPGMARGTPITVLGSSRRNAREAFKLSAEQRHSRPRSLSMPSK